MYTGVYHSHKLLVSLFILIYLIKTILLLAGKEDLLAKFSKAFKIPEMTVSFLFLATGIIMVFNKAVISPLFVSKILLVLLSIPIAIVAFKKRIKGLAVLSILMIVGAYGLAEIDKASLGKRKPLTTQLSNIQKEDQLTYGKALFEAQCVVCHGNNGDANLSGSKMLSTSIMSKEKIEDIIRNGKNSMPPMKKIYADNEIKSLAVYVESLR